MRSATLLLMLLGIAVILAACIDEQSTGEASDDQADATPASTATPTEPTESAAVPDDDPRELLLALDEASAREDFEFVYRHLTEQFQIIDFDPMWVRSLGVNLALFQQFTNGSIDLESLVVEEYADFAVVGVDGMPIGGWVFLAEGGKWRYDPGDHRLAFAAYASLPETDRGEHPWNVRAETEWDYEGFGEIFSPLRLSVQAVGIQGNEARITVNWDLEPVRLAASMNGWIDEHLRHDTIVPLDSVRWIAGDESGETEIVWTDAVVEADQLRLPGWGDFDVEAFSDGQQETLPGFAYRATFLAQDLPDEIDEIILEIDRIEIGPLGDDSPIAGDERLEMMTKTYIPAQTTSGVLIGEPPDFDPAGEVSDAPDPVPHDELSPAPPLEDVTVGSVEYVRAGNVTEATVRMEFAGKRIEFPGETLVHWDDGESSPPSLQILGDGTVELNVERESSAENLEIRSISFEAIARELESDTEAIFYDDRIETVWGAFPILNIVENSDQSSTIHYQPAGRRFIGNLQIDHDGDRVGIGSGSQSFDEHFVPRQGRVVATRGFLELRDDLPLPARVEVWQTDGGFTIDID